MYTDYSPGDSPNLHGLQLAKYTKETRPESSARHIPSNNPTSPHSPAKTISGDMMIVQRVLSADPDTFQSHMGSADRMCLSPSDYCLK